jgi:hypothetical protein
MPAGTWSPKDENGSLPYENDSARNGEEASAKPLPRLGGDGYAEGCAKVRCNPLRQSGPGSELGSFPAMRKRLLEKRASSTWMHIKLQYNAGEHKQLA